MSRRTIAIVEDERTIAAGLAARLEAEGFEVATAHDGVEGVELCLRIRPDLVILDLMLPGLDGIEVCRRIQATAPTAVLMLTARDSEVDMLVGLGVGADDYVTKPFSAREVVARVQAILRRIDRARSVPTTVTVGEIDLDLEGRRVALSGEVVHLTPTEFDLLAFLAVQPRRVFTRDDLLAEIWGYAPGAGSRTVDSHVRSIRRKLGNDVIRTVHGVGYGSGSAR